jgi:hypothetical protein
MALRRGAVLLASLLLASVGSVQAEDRAPPGPFLGLGPLDPGKPEHQEPARLEAWRGFGPLLVQTTPLAWGAHEPLPPLGERRVFDLRDLTAAREAWRGAGLEVVVVLSPASRWASVEPPVAGYAREVALALPAEARGPLLAEATGATPPLDDHWEAWGAFAREVAVRGVDDERRGWRGWMQVLAHPTRPTEWAGDEHEYLRLLHVAGLAWGAGPGDEVAGSVVHGAVDFRTLGREPFPDEAEVVNRARKAFGDAPDAVLFRERREATFGLRTLSTLPIYDAVPHVGSGHLADEAADLRFLRHWLDAHGGKRVEAWLVDTPLAKLEEPRVPVLREVPAGERRLRSTWRSAARSPRHPDHARARSWLQRGEAYDVVRTILNAKLAGADRILFGPDAGFLEPGPAGLPLPTPAGHALRQANAFLRGHVAVEPVAWGGPGQAARLLFPAGHDPRFVVVVALDPASAWAGPPAGPLPETDVAIPLADGAYDVVPVALSDEEPRRAPVAADGGVLRLRLTPAPVYVVPLR